MIRIRRSLRPREATQRTWVSHLVMLKLGQRFKAEDNNWRENDNYANNCYHPRLRTTVGVLKQQPYLSLKFILGKWTLLFLYKTFILSVEKESLWKILHQKTTGFRFACDSFRAFHKTSKTSKNWVFLCWFDERVGQVVMGGTRWGNFWRKDSSEDFESKGVSGWVVNLRSTSNSVDGILTEKFKL